MGIPLTSTPSVAGLRVCLVGINYAPDSTGIAPYTTAMAEALTNAGADVHVVTGVPHYPEWRVKGEQYARGARWNDLINGVRVSRVKHHVPSRPNLSGRGRMEASFLARAVPVVRRDRSDIIIAVTPSMSGLAAAVYGSKRRPLGVLVQDLTGNAATESGTTGGRTARLIGDFEYSLIGKADAVGVIAPQFRQVLTSKGIAGDRITDLPNFTHITPSTLGRDEARLRLGWGDSDYLVVHTGNMGMKQGLESVIHAARLSASQNLGISFILVGDGNQRAELESRASNLATVRFVNPLPSEAYPLALAAADALLINERPGVREMSLPSKLTSYTSASRPIIAAVEIGGITHSVISAEGAALIVTPGDGADLLDAAVALSRDPSRAASLAMSGRAMFEAHYAAELARSRYISFAAMLGALTGAAPIAG